MATRNDDNMRKVTVVGVGQVGMSVIFGLLAKRVTNHVALIDISTDKVQAEYLDLMHASIYLNDPIISAGTDYAISAGSSVCVIAVGARPVGNQTRLDVLHVNEDILKTIVPKLIKHSPKAILVVATNPLDVMSFATWKISGLPINRVIGSGCILDTARFCYFVAEKMGVSPTSIEGHIIGEHGESSVPVWSTLCVNGVRIMELNPDIVKDEDPELWSNVAKSVVLGGPTVRKGKGYTNWAVGLCIIEICDAILKNTDKILSCSTNVQNITNNICLIDSDEQMVKGEQIDLPHGAALLRYVTITAGTGLNIPPLQAVGWEGVFGFSVVSVLLAIFYWIPAPPHFGNNARGTVEDVVDGLVQIGNNSLILLSILGTVCGVSIAFFNFAGISVTKEMSATTRMVLDSVRTFGVLIYGMCEYNGLGLYDRCVRRPEPDHGESEVVNTDADAESDDVMA